MKDKYICLKNLRQINRDIGPYIFTKYKIYSGKEISRNTVEFICNDNIIRDISHRLIYFRKHEGLSINSWIKLKYLFK